MKTLRIVLVGLVLALAALAGGGTPADAQDAQAVLFTLDTPNPQAYAYFGLSLAVGDVNGDGRGDIAVGAYHEDVGGNDRQGRAYVFSGDDGSLLLTLDTPNAQAEAFFGGSVAVGDVNGDSRGDIAVGAYGEDVGGNDRQGRAYVFSGADGSLLLTLGTPNPQAYADFGYSLAVGDVNADGKGDIAVGAYGEDVGGNEGEGRAYVFSGPDGSLLFTLHTPNPQAYAYFGGALALGDVSGDGRGDIAVGAVHEDVGGNDKQGRAYVFSGADGSLLFTLDTPNAQAEAYFSLSLAVGEVNDDGRADIAVGAPLQDVGGNVFQGRAYLFSGADGSLLSTLDTPNPQEAALFGYSLAVGDVNGDGKADIAVGAENEDVGGNDGQGRAYVFSGADGSLLLTLDTPNPQAQARFGASAAVGHVNVDGRADIGVGAPEEYVGGNDRQGRAYVFAWRPPPAVGGIAQLPNVSDSSGPNYIALGGLAAAALVALSAGGWYARRRWLS